MLNPVSERAYKVTVSDINACINVDSTIVDFQFPTEVEFDFVGQNCERGIKIGQVTGGNAPYLYSLEPDRYAAQTDYPFLEEGKHTLYLLDSLGCKLDTTFHINPIPDLIVELGDDPLVKLGDSLRLNVQTNRPVSQLQWRNLVDSLSCLNCPSPSMLPLATQSISLEVEDELGCVGTDNLTIRVDRTHEIYMPNTFTPNGDGINDWMSVYTGKSEEAVLNIKIFDLLGNLIFERQNPQKNEPKDGWDGYFKGKLMPESVYICLAEVLFIDGYKGHFTTDVALVK